MHMNEAGNPRCMQMSTRKLIQDNLRYNHIPTVRSLALADQFLLLGYLKKRAISRRSR